MNVHDAPDPRRKTSGEIVTRFMLIQFQLVDVKWIDTSRIVRVGFSRIEKYPERIRSTVVRGSIEMFLREYSCHAKGKVWNSLRRNVTVDCFKTSKLLSWISN